MANYNGISGWVKLVRGIAGGVRVNHAYQMANLLIYILNGGI